MIHCWGQVVLSTLPVVLRNDPARMSRECAQPLTFGLWDPMERRALSGNKRVSRRSTLH